MASTPAIQLAVELLREVHDRAKAGDPEFAAIVSARDEVLARYQRVFNPSRLNELTEEEVKGFLKIKNNRHWPLVRLGGICRDMPKLRRALAVLLDDKRPIRDRLNEIVPKGGTPMVERLNRAVLTPILMIMDPANYTVWNGTSRRAMKRLGIYPDLGAAPLGEKYDRINNLGFEIARTLGVDSWTLDALWWRLKKESSDAEEGEEPDGADAADEGAEVGEAQRFGLERHLHEFLCDNWSRTSLGRNWEIYSEDGEEDDGIEYPCPGVGRIDILAWSKGNAPRRWLVVELKREQSSDKTAGQVLSYMGWVRENLARDGGSVEGLVIARTADERLRYALGQIPAVKVLVYDVQFTLRDPNDGGSSGARAPKG